MAYRHNIKGDIHMDSELKLDWKWKNGRKKNRNALSSFDVYLFADMNKRYIESKTIYVLFMDIVP